MNILLLATDHIYSDFHQSSYPLCLTAFQETPLIEHLIKQCHSLDPMNLIVAFHEQDIMRHHLNKIAHSLAPEAHILRIAQDTQGSACTALLGIGRMNQNDELLILDCNGFLEVNFAQIRKTFLEHQLDAGTVTFSSTTAQRYYVRLNAKNQIIEAAEKSAISSTAAAGFLWFAKGKDFIQSAQNMIRKDAALNGTFPLFTVLNELVLERKRIGAYLIESPQYHSLRPVIGSEVTG